MDAEFTGNGGGTEHTGAGGDAPSFWKTLPGYLTALTGFIVACSGMVTGLSQAGFIGARADKAHAAGTASASALVDPANASGVPLAPRRHRASPLREYRIGSMSDGFAYVRKEPTIESEGLRKLPSGTHLECGIAVVDI